MDSQKLGRTVALVITILILCVLFGLVNYVFSSLTTGFIYLFYDSINFVTVSKGIRAIMTILEWSFTLPGIIVCIKKIYKE